MINIHHFKLIAIRLVFLFSPLTFCFFLFSSNSIHKKIDNNPYGQRQIIYSCTRLNNSIANSDITSLNHLSATIMVLTYAHTDWIKCWYTQGDPKTGRFTTVIQNNSLCQMNQQTPVILVLAYYLCLICLQYDSILCLKIFQV